MTLLVYTLQGILSKSVFFCHFYWRTYFPMWFSSDNFSIHCLSGNKFINQLAKHGDIDRFIIALIISTLSWSWAIWNKKYISLSQAEWWYTTYVLLFSTSGPNVQFCQSHISDVTSLFIKTDSDQHKTPRQGFLACLEIYIFKTCKWKII